MGPGEGRRENRQRFVVPAPNFGMQKGVQAKSDDRLYTDDRLCPCVDNVLQQTIEGSPGQKKQEETRLVAVTENGHARARTQTQALARNFRKKPERRRVASFFQVKKNALPGHAERSGAVMPKA